MKIFIDGPFGAPASNIFRAEHAVLIATGIGVTPFSAILQSIMNRYKDIKRECPRCNLKWNDDIAAHSSSQNLKKVSSRGPQTTLNKIENLNILEGTIVTGTILKLNMY